MFKCDLSFEKVWKFLIYLGFEYLNIFIFELDEVEFVVVVFLYLYICVFL